MIGMKGYQPKKIDRSKIEVPRYLEKSIEHEYEYKVTFDGICYSAFIENLLNDGWSIFNVINHMVIFRREKYVKEIQD